MDSKQKVTFIKDWILNYVNSMPKKAQSLVIGISGGIDSSVSSTLSAMTGLKTIVLSMPIKQKSAQHDLSLKHQEWLKQNFKNLVKYFLKGIFFKLATNKYFFNLITFRLFKFADINNIKFIRNISKTFCIRKRGTQYQ